MPASSTAAAPANPAIGQNAPTLQVTNLRAGVRDREILKGITLHASRGEILAAIGPAGAGKTTFLRCLNRMTELDPDMKISGEILLDGISIYAKSVEIAMLRRQVGMVFSVPTPLPMSIYENLTFGWQLAYRRSSAVDERIESSLRAAYLWEEIKDRLKEPARNLSGGQQQRLCLARTLIMQPKILLLDEPCSGLDPISTGKIEEALQQLKSNLTIVLVTNNVKQAARASDRTAFFLFGEIVEVDRTEKLFTMPKEKTTADYISGRFG
jgi:phosphate transport system ATP-binding protein